MVEIHDGIVEAIPTIHTRISFNGLNVLICYNSNMPSVLRPWPWGQRDRRVPVSTLARVVLQAEVDRVDRTPASIHAACHFCNIAERRDRTIFGTVADLHLGTVLPVPQVGLQKKSPPHGSVTTQFLRRAYSVRSRTCRWLSPPLSSRLAAMISLGRAAVPMAIQHS